MSEETEPPGRASRPVILAVDDEPAVLRAVERDLRRKFGGDYRVLRAESGAVGVELLDELLRRGEQVALLLVDQRMPQMDGVAFLEEARSRYPEAAKVLLTAYADTEAAIRAINDIRLDYYLLKPWDPPEERLYPVVEGLLDDWQDNVARRRGGIRVIGHRLSARSHAMRDLLARNQRSAVWVDIERDGAEARRLLDAAGLADPELPVVLLEDGTTIEAPTPLELAARLGLQTQASRQFYDLVIVGGGPAGLGAAVYGASEGLDTLMLDREAPGGQAGQSSLIENYLGFPRGLSGEQLAKRAADQARRFGAEMLTLQEVVSVTPTGSSFSILLSDGTELGAHTVVVATGVSYRRLEAPGVEELTGTGVFYGAAMTEGDTCKGQDVVVIGGANSAGQGAVYFADHAKTVHLVIRSDSIRKGMSSYLVDKIEATENIEVHVSTQVAAVHGDGHLETVDLVGPDGARTIPAAAVFVFIGAQPRTDWLGDLVARDERGFVLTGPDVLVDGKPPRGWPVERDPQFLETSTPGMFAAGDVRHRSVKRVASAVGEGAMVVQFIHHYLADR